MPQETQVPCDMEKLVHWAAGRFCARFPFLSFDDLVQECWVATLEGKGSYDARKGVSLFTWLATLMNNRMLDFAWDWGKYYRITHGYPLPFSGRCSYGGYGGRKGWDNLLEDLRVILSPLAWKILVIKIESFPARCPVDQVARELSIRKEDCEHGLSEIKRSTLLILGMEGENVGHHRRGNHLCFSSSS